MLGVTIQIDGYDPVAGVAVSLNASSHDDARVCHLNAQQWWPVIAKLPTLSYDLFDGTFGEQVTSPSSSMSLSVEPWPNFGRYALGDARFRLWTGEVGDDWSLWTLRFDGRVSAQPRMQDQIAQIDFAVDDRWLDTPLLATYAGTTGAEGPAAMKGQVKPLSLGAARYVAGALIDSVNSVFQVSAYGLIEGFEAALERLARFGAPIANYASYAALVAATIPPGAWATANAVGMARFGAPTTGQISFLVSGDKAGPNGWARRPGQLIRRIALLSGGAGKIDDGSLDALDAARPYNVSLQLNDQTTAREVIQKLAASVNAVAGVSWTGKLFVATVGLGAATVTLAADGSALPPVGSVRQIDIAAPWKKLAIGAERAWTVHALADIAFTAPLLDMGAYAASTTYREGNIVQDQGSSWIYVATGPSAGNPPPTLPTTSNAFWRTLARAGAAGSPGTNSYFHTAFANSPNGIIDFTTDLPGGRAYIGTYSDFAAADSTDPNVYTWAPYKGPANFGLVAGGTATAASNMLVLTQSAGTWGLAGGNSTEGWKSGAQTSFYLDAGTFGGLNTDPTTDLNYTSIDYAWHRSDDGNIYIYEGGGSFISTGPAGSNDRLQISYDNQAVRYYKNGALVRTIAAAADLTLYFDAALSGAAGGKVREINFSAAAKAGTDGLPGTPGVSPVTISAQPEAVQINVDGSGVPQNLPQAIGNIATRAGSSVAITNVTVVSVNGVTAAVSGSSINITATSGGVDGEVVYDVTAAGQTVRKRVGVTITRSGADGSVATTLGITTPQLTWTSYQQHGGTLAINASASGKIDVNLVGAMRCALGGSLQFYSKLQYRATGGTFTDVAGTERLSTLSEQLSDPTRQTNANVNGVGPYSLTGLTPSGAYELRVLTYKTGTSDSSTSVNMTLSGKQVA